MSPRREREDRRHEPACWRYELGGGWLALAGRSARDNDLLTFRLARPGDLWFHLKGMAGSHVVLTGGAGGEPPPPVLRAAAAIAAWHSKARGAGKVPVLCARAVDVRKPRGAPPGTVTTRRGKVIKVRPALPGG